mmetsp:Transcript_23028/g.26278  ORF Transcript_23028/g.26278 Transcript_23028/m.26278 type:complete len:259 (-) Transcript_23028:45-821(-)
MMKYYSLFLLSSATIHSLLLQLLLLTPQCLSENDHIVNCTLCGNNDFFPTDSGARVNFGDVTRSCQDMFDRGIIRLPQKNCSFLQNRGTTICKCSNVTEEENKPKCNLCEDPNETLKTPTLISLPGEFCALTQNTARIDDTRKCIHYQGVIGVYCLCESNIGSSSDQVCRICGDKRRLPNPQKEAGNSTCIYHEFIASMMDNCVEVQSLYADTCCPTSPPSSTLFSTSNGSKSNDVKISRTIISSLLMTITTIIWAVQ